MWGLLKGLKVSGRVFVIKQEGLRKETSESKSSEHTCSHCCDLRGS